jgi:uncharacterized membrane protein
VADENKKTILGISENLEGLIAYAAGWVSGLVLLLLEKENQFVRFHALQSLVTFLGLTIVSAVVSIVIPVLGLMISGLLWLAGLALWILLMIKAYQGEKYKLPKIGDFCEQQLAKK